MKLVTKYKRRWVLALLICYSFSFLTWWTYLLYQKNEIIFAQQREEISVLSSEQLVQFHKDKNRQRAMIIAEGITFFLLLIWIIWQLKRTFDKELRLAEQQRNFLLSVTHELKSPIAAATLNIQTLKKFNLDTEKRTLICNNAEQDLFRLNALVEKILLAAKVEANVFNIDHNIVDFSKILQECIDEWSVHQQKDFLWENRIQQEVHLRGDEVLLKCLCSNLIENAIKFTSEGGIISIALAQSGANITFQVADNGIGIPDEEKHKIFNKFYRIGNEERRTTIGTGLGLFLVKKIVALHSGKMEVLNNIPQGVIFKITFEH
ncbi:MAG: HAMP domain-containing histidine kinase [Chitinophagales bacterium]|nr:HAMP domain-containing histidine kinase [Chitinophagales bacterium]